jgi:SulP family sulfate permease
VQNFNAKFDANNDPKNIEIDFIESKVSDHSGIEALSSLAHKYMEKGKKVTLTHLSPECKTLLLKADPALESMIETSIDDPRYWVVTDLLDREV